MTAVRAQNSPIQVEGDWLPADLEQLPDALKVLRERLIEAGRPSAEVHGITGWLVAKALGDPDTTAAPTRSRYRRILRELGEPPRWPKPRKGGTPIMHVTRVLSGRRRQSRAEVQALVETVRAEVAGYAKAS